MGWREALNFEHPIKGWQHLWIRYATNLDIKKDDTKGENSRYYKFAQRTASMNKGRRDDNSSRYGSHPGDRKTRDRQTTERLGKKQISKKEKYGRHGRRGRRRSDSDESSDLDNSAEKNAKGSDSKEQLPLDDG